MTDQRRHRGPHPEDLRLFARGHWSALRQATADMSWLLTRGYAPVSALKLVGDRYALDARQRLAVVRSAASDQAVKRRTAHRIGVEEVRGQELWLDGYNVLITVEAALARGVVLRGRDDCYRDMASLHGTYRRVEETVPALELVGACLQEWELVSIRWLLDQPVSNSGRLKALMLEIAQTHGWAWDVELVPAPDPVLKVASAIVATSDSQILDAAARWLNLARIVIEATLPATEVIDLGKENLNGDEDAIDPFTD